MSSSDDKPVDWASLFVELKLHARERERDWQQQYVGGMLPSDWPDSRPHYRWSWQHRVWFLQGDRYVRHWPNIVGAPPRVLRARYRDELRCEVRDRWAQSDGFVLNRRDRDG